MRILLLFFLLSPNTLWANTLDGATLSLNWSIPFIGILLSLAFCPLLIPRLWHNHFGKIIFFWSLSFLVPFAAIFHVDALFAVICQSIFVEYIPFVLLIGALFITTGSIRLRTSWQGTPWGNTCILLAGVLLASCVGTTGASMILIRPLLQANAWRRYKTHIFIFFIFLVSNIGGALTPLGDPPLFIGFLQGVPFFWPLFHLYGPVLFSTVFLLIVFLGIEHYCHPKEDIKPLELLPKPIKIEGRRNLFCLGGIISAVLLSGLWKSGITLKIYHTHIALESIIRDLLMIVFSIISLLVTKKQVREENHFSWDPLLEVAKIFAGIFVTVDPVLAILKAGTAGKLGHIISLVNKGGIPNDTAYFWLTGAFSSILDNAPTYLVFFFMAGGETKALTGPLASTLSSISQGAVFMGALTYIGNAPNFMVRSMLEHRGVKMPGFFGYMLWSFSILLPLFALLSFLF